MSHAAGHRLLAAGAVLEDLTPAERATRAARLAGCRECRALEQELEVVLGELALVAEERVPPTGLLAAILRSITALDAGGGAPGDAGRGLARGDR